MNNISIRFKHTEIVENFYLNYYQNSYQSGKNYNKKDILKVRNICYDLMQYLNKYNTDYTKVANIINSYIQYCKELENEYNANCKLPIFRTRTEFYSSVLEEVFTRLLFSNEKYISFFKLNPNIDFILGPSNCLVKTANGTLETKNVDVGFAISLGTGNILLSGYDIKTYVDKSMYNGILQAKNEFKNYNNDTDYGFITLMESRNKSLVSQTEFFNNEFILSGEHRNKIVPAKIKPELLKSCINVVELNIHNKLMNFQAFTNSKVYTT